MVNVKDKVLEVLETIPGIKTFIFYPENFNTLPAISFYELTNTEEFSLNSVEKISRVTIQIDIFADKMYKADDLAILVDSKMKSIDFKREFCGDLFESPMYHKTMRYRVLIADDNRNNF